jgi:hypothetical protein
MAKRNAENNYNTNLASEYLMMSLLSRTGQEAYLSLGNKKGVDIIVRTKTGGTCILEVKGVNKKSDDWIINNKGIFPQVPNLFYALVSYDSEIENLNAPAKFWLIPALILAAEGQHKVSKNKKTVFLSHKNIKDNYENFKNNFESLRNYLNEN